MKPKIKTMPELRREAPSLDSVLCSVRFAPENCQLIAGSLRTFTWTQAKSETKTQLRFPARQVSVHRNRYFHFSFLFPHFSSFDFRCADRTRTFLLNFIRRQTGLIRIELHSNICFRSKNIFRHFYWLLVAFLSYTFRFFSGISPWVIWALDLELELELTQSKCGRVISKFGHA